MSNSEEVTYFCHGSGPASHSRVAGWAYVWRHRAQTGYDSAAAPGLTNNAAELLAAIRALEHARAFGLSRCTIRSDSEYVVKGASCWLPRWKKNGWRTKGGGQVANRELWGRLDRLCQDRAVRWEWARRACTREHELAITLSQTAATGRVHRASAKLGQSAA